MNEKITLRGYHEIECRSAKPIRPIAINGHGKIKPALIITNDFYLTTQEIVRKYARRWLVEKGISEQIEFFHLNRVSSSIVIKVDFDMVMTILAHNLYRLFASELERYSSFTAERIYEKFIVNKGYIDISADHIQIELKKKRDLSQLLEMMKENEELKFPWLENKKIIFHTVYRHFNKITGLVKRPLRYKYIHSHCKIGLEGGIAASIAPHSLFGRGPIRNTNFLPTKTSE